MPATASSQPSFSRRQKWRIAFQVCLVTLTVFSIVVMVNYLSADYPRRLHLSTQTHTQLSSRTVHFLKTITNQISVILYYDRNDSLYTTVAELLNEYHLANPNITVRTVDYLRDPGAAQTIKSQYKLGSLTEKNLVIFDCEGRVKMVDGKALADYATEQVAGETEMEFRTRPVTFKGELMFTSVLLAVTNPKPLKAYFLTGHGEHAIDSADELSGYLKFAAIFQQNYVQVHPLSLLGTNAVPADCHLLVIAGPSSPIAEPELNKIEQYLDQGGRLLTLFKFESIKRETGLEKVLAEWGVDVGANVIKDPENTLSGSDIIVGRFGSHPVVDPLAGESRLHLLLPRSIGKLKSPSQNAEAPQVYELAFSGPKSYVMGDPSKRQVYPLMVAVEKGAIKGVLTERGATRMIVVGDSLFLANRQIESASNRDFGGYLINWLLDRPQLLHGLGPKPLAQYRLVMTNRQIRSTQVLLLAGMPGAVLVFGALVWLRRRH